MWNLNLSITVLVLMSTGIIQCLLAISISSDSEKFEENLSFRFDEPMDKCNNMKEDIIQFVNSGLEILNDNFIISDHVKSINLENNKISYISPIAFNGVPNLSCLNIRENYMDTIFDFFLPLFNHTKLITLNLAYTAFKDPAKQPGHQEIIDYLDSTKNKTISVRRSSLPNVKYLDLSQNNLILLPTYLNDVFPNLKYLYLSDMALSNNYLDRIPVSTEYLYLERNIGKIDITNFPQNIVGLFLNENNFESNFGSLLQYPNLKILSLRKCKDVYEIFRYFNSRTLVDLDISYNNIDYIDAKFFYNSKSLQRLSLDRNSLETLYFLIPLNALTDLSIAYNKLVNITTNYFQNMKLLKKLNLRGNRIAVITSSEAFSKMIMLEKLDLAENHLTTLPILWMQNLTNLQYLNLKSNLFPSIDKMYIHNYSRLTHLFVENNNFTQIEITSLMNMPSNVVIHLSSINSYTCLT